MSTFHFSCSVGRQPRFRSPSCSSNGSRAGEMVRPDECYSWLSGSRRASCSTRYWGNQCCSPAPGVGAISGGRVFLRKEGYVEAQSQGETTTISKSTTWTKEETENTYTLEWWWRHGKRGMSKGFFWGILNAKKAEPFLTLLCSLTIEYWFHFWYIFVKRRTIIVAVLDCFYILHIISF
jgi:hypothetical protein